MLNRKALALIVWTMLVSLGAADMATAQPVLQRAASRKLHGSVSYDVALPLNGASGVEGRSVSGGMTLVLTFDRAVTSGSAAVTAGKAAVSGLPSFAGNAMTVNLTNVTNAQLVTLTVSNVVAGNGGGTLASASVPFRVLLGDVNSNGAVTAADVNIVKAAVGSAVTGFNFRCDVNANGAISSSDVNVVKAAVGTSAAGGATNNTAPTITALAALNTTTGTAVGGSFTVGDGESTPDSLALVATSDNPTLLPVSGITLGGTGASRTVTCTPAAGQTGTAHVTLTAGDGLTSTSTTFAVNVTTAPTNNGTPTLFIATLAPQSGVVSSASGTSLLTLSADNTYATIKISYSNLTTPLTGMHVHGPADPGQSGGVLFDIDAAIPQADGSYKWVFAPTGTLSVADQVTAIKAGRTYVNVHTSQYPSGEIRGQYALASGSISFTPPPSPPSLPGGLPTQQDATRFLAQATYGPTQADVSDVMTNGIDNWLSRQFAMSQTSQLQTLQQWKAAGMSINPDQYWSSWWKLANTAPDQLRQRVGFALSEIFVTSMRAATLDSHPNEMANYYDLLARDGFGNFRQLLEDVTLSPVMGRYLDMLGSRKADPVAGTNPNENFAREINQLLSIGLYQLQPDGTLKLDQNGLPIPTYDQNVVVGFARALTGWDYHQSGTPTDYPTEDLYNPMTLIPSRHETGTKLLLNGLVLPAGQDGNTDLKQTLDCIFNHPNVGPFISKQLIQKLVTSNPSPGYVYRVAQVFNNNGSGVRGDMKAVIRAILTDYEARSPDVINQQGYGKLREPLLRTTAVMRAFNAYSVSNPQQWFINNTDFDLGQSVLYAQTVFNFFQPGYVQAGTLAQAGLVAPEFQVIDETKAITVKNWFYWGIWYGFQYADIKLDLSYQQSLASNVPALVDHLNQLMLAGEMSDGMRLTLVTYLSSLPASDPLGRARTAVYLVATSPAFAVQR